MLAQRILVLVSGIVFAPLAACTDSASDAVPHDVLDHGLVLVGPSDSLKQHAEYVQNMWPDAFAVGIVRLTETPVCSGQKAENVGVYIVYCWATVSAEELIAGGWTHLGQPGTTNSPEFTLHYWYPNEQPHTWNIGDRLVTFLAPTHSPTVYSATALLDATDEALSHVRNAFR